MNLEEYFGHLRPQLIPSIWAFTERIKVMLLKLKHYYKLLILSQVNSRGLKLFTYRTTDKHKQ